MSSVRSINSKYSDSVPFPSIKIIIYLTFTLSLFLIISLFFGFTVDFSFFENRPQVKTNFFRINIIFLSLIGIKLIYSIISDFYVKSNENQVIREFFHVDEKNNAPVRTYSSYFETLIHRPKTGETQYILTCSYCEDNFNVVAQSKSSWYTQFSVVLIFYWIFLNASLFLLSATFESSIPLILISLFAFILLYLYIIIFFFEILGRHWIILDNLDNRHQLR